MLGWAKFENAATGKREDVLESPQRVEQAIPCSTVSNPAQLSFRARSDEQGQKNILQGFFSFATRSGLRMQQK